MPDLTERIPERQLLDFVLGQRWFGAASREPASARVLAAPTLRAEAPPLVLALVEIGFRSGRPEVYQLPLGFRPAGERWERAVVARDGGWTAYDALADPALACDLARLVREAASVRADGATIDFQRAAGSDRLGGQPCRARPIGSEQSNSSVVLDERLILKVYRRLAPGPNPELELLRFLTERDFPNVAPLRGWYSCSGPQTAATLGLLQAFVSARCDGWELVLCSLAGEPVELLGPLRRLGEVTGALHVALGSEHRDPRFRPERLDGRALGLLAETLERETARAFADLPQTKELAPVGARRAEVRARLRALGRLGPGGQAIRHHGDYHLGQALWTGDDWTLIDFEGEPARPLPERRRKRSPLRDVAGMLRSLAYAAAAGRARGVEPPAGWEERARAAFLDGYLAAADPRLLPASDEATAQLLAAFELEKAVYELRYELDHRPAWATIPAADILRLLDSPSPP